MHLISSAEPPSNEKTCFNICEHRHRLAALQRRQIVTSVVRRHDSIIHCVHSLNCKPLAQNRFSRNEVHFI